MIIITGYKNLIKSDIEKIRKNANFNIEQSQIFEELIKPSYQVTENDVAIYQKLNFSERKFYKIKKEVKTKVERILN